MSNVLTLGINKCLSSGAPYDFMKFIWIGKSLRCKSESKLKLSLWNAFDPDWISRLS